MAGSYPSTPPYSPYLLSFPNPLFIHFPSEKSRFSRDINRIYHKRYNRTRHKPSNQSWSCGYFTLYPLSVTNIPWFFMWELYCVSIILIGVQAMYYVVCGFLYSPQHWKEKFTWGRITATNMLKWQGKPRDSNSTQIIIGN